MKQKTVIASVLLACAILAFGGVPLGADEKPMGAISASKLAKSPGDYYGRTVTVHAEVEDVLGPNMFTLDEDAILAGPDVLVLVPAGVTGALAHDQKVTVVGEVRKYVEADLDRDFDWFDRGKLVDVKTKVDWETRPVIVARAVRTAAGTDLLGTSDRLLGAPIVSLTEPGGLLMTVTATALAKHPRDYYGKQVTVKAEVEDVLGANMFTLDEDALFAGPDVLVLVPRGMASTLAHDQVVEVSGTVRAYTETELKRDFDWFDPGKLVDVKTKVEWETRPVIVANSIRTATGAEIVNR